MRFHIVSIYQRAAPTNRTFLSIHNRMDRSHRLTCVRVVCGKMMSPTTLRSKETDIIHNFVLINLNFCRCSGKLYTSQRCWTCIGRLSFDGSFKSKYDVLTLNLRKAPPSDNIIVANRVWIFFWLIRWKLV